MIHHSMLTAHGTNPRTVTAQVSARLLGEVPRFFSGSLDTMLRELLQNAFRAGAQNVVVTLDPAQRTLAVQDDGCGIADPQVVITAGATGWDETQVIEPAGLGLFSLLTRDVHKVVVASRANAPTGWRMTLTRDALAGLPVPVEELTGECPVGTIVQVTFVSATQLERPDKKEPNVPEPLVAEVQQARSLYPFRLTLVLDDAEPMTIHPWRSWKPYVTLDVPGLGTVEWAPDLDAHRSQQIVWAHQAVYAHAFEKALDAAAGKDQAFALFHTGGIVRWIIDPSCGVRPKLPDRKDLIEDTHLAHAVKRLASALGQHLLGLVKAEADRLPDTLNLDDPLPLSLPWLKIGDGWYHHRYAVLERVLLHLGWVASSLNVYENYNIYRTDDGIEVDRSTVDTLHRTLPRVGSQVVAFTLTQMGKPTRFDKSIANADPVQVSGLRFGKDNRHVALCKKIVVKEIGELPFLISENGFTADDEEGNGLALERTARHGKGKHRWSTTHTPCILFAGNAAQFTQFLKKNAEWLLRLVVVAEHERGNLYDTDWLDDDDVDYGEVERDLLIKVAQYDPKLAAVRTSYYDAEDALRELHQISLRVGQLQRIAKNPALRKLLQQPVNQFQRAGDELYKQIEKARADLARQAGLAETK